MLDIPGVMNTPKVILSLFSLTNTTEKLTRDLEKPEQNP